MKGKLSVCATPIGNLEDVTFRVLRTLKEADLIACEDTRQTGKLLAHYEISTPMISYHKFNERERTPSLIQMMQEGKHVALVSDAGTPLISDPGGILVAACHEAGIKVTALPGPCALIAALSMAGFQGRRFVFEGFLPTERKDIETVLNRAWAEKDPVIFYEAPHRLLKTLEAMRRIMGDDRELILVRELTKTHEELKSGTLGSLTAFYQEEAPRGEFVIILKGQMDGPSREDDHAWGNLTIEEHMRLYKALPEKEAMKRVAAERGIAKRDVYAAIKTNHE